MGEQDRAKQDLLLGKAPSRVTSKARAPSLLQTGSGHSSLGSPTASGLAADASRTSSGAAQPYVCIRSVGAPTQHSSDAPCPHCMAALAAAVVTACSAGPVASNVQQEERKAGGRQPSLHARHKGCLSATCSWLPCAQGLRRSPLWTRWGAPARPPSQRSRQLQPPPSPCQASSASRPLGLCQLQSSFPAGPLARGCPRTCPPRRNPRPAPGCRRTSATRCRRRQLPRPGRPSRPARAALRRPDPGVLVGSQIHELRVLQAPSNRWGCSPYRAASCVKPWLRRAVHLQRSKHQAVSAVCQQTTTLAVPLHGVQLWACAAAPRSHHACSQGCCMAAARSHKRCSEHAAPSMRPDCALQDARLRCGQPRGGAGPLAGGPAGRRPRQRA